MNKITKDGFVRSKWDSTKREYVEEKTDNLIANLKDDCDIEGATLLDIFNMVDKNDLLKTFISNYSQCPVDEFHQQAKEIHEQKEENPLDFLEIYHNTESHQVVEKIKHPGGLRERIKIIDFETSADFHGIGPDENGKVIQWAVSYNPMYELAHLEVKLNKKVEIYKPFARGEQYDPNVVHTTKREFTLLDILDAIYYDISFVGGPQENKEFLEDMKE